jgi:hypothetical protein
VSELEKVKSLIQLALSEGYNEHEARTAAMMAVRLIHQHNLLESTPTVIHVDLVSELVDNVLDTCVTMLEFDSTWLISVADVLGAVFEAWEPYPDHVTRRRVYHRVRYRLEDCVTRGLLTKMHSKGYVLRNGASLDDFGFKRV